jgi:hypothetical protein
MSTVRRDIPLLILAVSGIIVLADNFIAVDALKIASDSLQKWAVIIVGFATGVGVINLARLHLRHVIRQTKERNQWIFSAVLLIIMFVVLLAGLFGGTENPVYRFGFDSIYTPTNATIYALLAFWIVSAAYRAMRARSIEAFLLLVVAFIIMMKDTPLFLTRLPVIGDIANWINNVLMIGGNRGLIITGALGLIILGIRTLTGRYPRALGSVE